MNIKHVVSALIIISSISFVGCGGAKTDTKTKVEKVAVTSTESDLSNSVDGKAVINLVKTDIQAYNTSNISQIKSDLVSDAEHARQLIEIQKTLQTSGLVYAINSLSVTSVEKDTAIVNYDVAVTNRNGSKTFRPYKKKGVYGLKKIGGSWRVQSVQDRIIEYTD